LNVLPGLGAGYLYQRRWRPYWITSAISTSWFALGAWLAQNRGATQESDRWVGLAGLVLLAVVLILAAASGRYFIRASRRFAEELG
jgi:ABC-type Mn2+/Zn2+ transport system permease subunit